MTTPDKESNTAMDRTAGRLRSTNLGMAGHCISDDSGRLIAVAQTADSAERIVTACNAFETMREALALGREAAVDLASLMREGAHDAEEIKWCRVVDKIDAALKGVTQPATEAGKLSSAANDVLAERERQKAVEGWTHLHDDTHDCCELASAAACYCLGATTVSRGFSDSVGGSVTATINLWPVSWPLDWWKPKRERRNLVRAGALILAEIERLDRAEAGKISTDEVKS